jgi:hypothetical protein
MRPWRLLTVGGLLVLLLGLVCLSTGAASPNPESPNARPLDYQLLTNPGVEVYDPPYGQFDGIDCQVATGWQRFWYDGDEPCWMDTRVFASSPLGSGWVERMEGETSQLIIATEPYTAGIQQTVTGLTPGLGYGFHAAMLTVYQTSAPPAVDGTMIKQVGLDPTGGTDPTAPTVIWDAPDDHDEGPWSIDLRTAAYAESPTMTVFVRVLSPLESGGLPYLNYSFLDSAILARTPVVTATSPAATDVPTFTVNWNNAQAAPGGGSLKWRDVQWLDEAEGVWHDWITHTYEVEAIFAGEKRHVYRFRARAWQQYPNGAHLYSPYRPLGDTQTVVGPPLLTGQVLLNDGQPLPGATVAVSGTAYATTSGAGGYYELEVQSWPDPQTIVVSHPTWLSPPPVYGVTFRPTDTVALTWTLRPPDDAVSNGQFEAGLAGWTVEPGLGLTPTVVTEPLHSGGYALALGGAAPVSQTVGVRQTVVLSDVWEPVLSLWYRPVTTDTDDLFRVILTVVTQTISPTLPFTTTYVYTPALDADSWQHAWFPAGPPKTMLTATVTVAFELWTDGDDASTTVYLDEVSLGRTPGGPFHIYLPVVGKQTTTKTPRR